MIQVPSAATTTFGSGPRPANVPPSPAPATPAAVISPARRDYLRSQALRVLGNGGSEADVVEMLRIEADRPITPNVVVTGDAERRQMGLIEGLSTAAFQGLTFGFGDEVIGSLLGILSGEGARGGIDAYREDYRRWAEENKGLSVAAEIVGAIGTAGVGVGVGAARAAQSGSAAIRAAGAAATPGAASTSVGARIAQNVAAGAAGGAAEGAGRVESAADASILERLSDRAKGAIFGGIIGGGAAGTLAGAGRVIGSIARPTARATTRATLPAPLALQVQEKIPGLGTAEEHAREIVWRALQADGITNSTQLHQRITEKLASGSPFTLADLGDEAILKLSAEASALRTPAQKQLIEALATREAEQPDRLIGALVQGVFRGHKLGARNAYEASEALMSQMQKQADPLYRKAHAETIPTPARLLEIFNNPELGPQFRKAYEFGKTLADGEDFVGTGHGLKIPPLSQLLGEVESPAAKFVADLRAANPTMTDETIQRVVAQRFPEGAPTAQALSEVPVRALDYMKRGIDELVERGIDGPPLSRKAASTYREALNQLLAQADEASSAFGAARAIWQDHKTAIEMIETGLEAQRKNVNAHFIRKVMSDPKLTPAQKDLYRMGFIQGLNDKIYKTPGEFSNAAQRFFGATPSGRKSMIADQIRALYPEGPAGEQAARDFISKANFEARLSETARKGVRGPKDGAISEFERAQEGAVPNVRMTPFRTLAGIVLDGLKVSQRSFMKDVADEISLLFAKGIDDPRELQILADQMEYVHRKVIQPKGFLARGATAALGAQAAGAVSGN